MASAGEAKESAGACEGLTGSTHGAGTLFVPRLERDNTKDTTLRKLTTACGAMSVSAALLVAGCTSSAARHSGAPTPPVSATASSSPSPSPTRPACQDVLDAMSLFDNQIYAQAKSQPLRDQGRTTAGLLEQTIDGATGLSSEQSAAAKRLRAAVAALLKRGKQDQEVMSELRLAEQQVHDSCP